VRVGRVDPPTLEGAEAPGPFPYMQGTTVDVGWPEALAALKKRGATTILSDQRLTTTTGFKAQIQSERQVPIIAVNFADVNNVQKRSAVVKTGCKFEVTPTGGSFRYEAEARWALAADEVPETEAPPQLTTAWDGTHPDLDGSTLVLHYREQIKAAKDRPARAVEIYALITGRLIPAK
jgi:hypothetical protein